MSKYLENKAKNWISAKFWTIIYIILLLFSLKIAYYAIVNGNITYPELFRFCVLFGTSVRGIRREYQ